MATARLAVECLRYRGSRQVEPFREAPDYATFIPSVEDSLVSGQTSITCKAVVARSELNRWRRPFRFTRFPLHQTGAEHL
jgi:hypothetical protein